MMDRHVAWKGDTSVYTILIRKLLWTWTFGKFGWEWDNNTEKKNQAKEGKCIMRSIIISTFH
jgi:hypothetical protein